MSTQIFCHSVTFMTNHSRLYLSIIYFVVGGLALRLRLTRFLAYGLYVCSDYRTVKLMTSPCLVVHAARSRCLRPVICPQNSKSIKGDLTCPLILGTNSVLNISSSVLAALFSSQIGFRTASPKAKYSSLGLISIPRNSAASTNPLIVLLSCYQEY